MMGGGDRVNSRHYHHACTQVPNMSRPVIHHISFHASACVVKRIFGVHTKKQVNPN